MIRSEPSRLPSSTNSTSNDPPTSPSRTGVSRAFNSGRVSGALYTGRMTEMVGRISEKSLDIYGQSRTIKSIGFFRSGSQDQSKSEHGRLAQYRARKQAGGLIGRPLAYARGTAQSP